MRGTWLAIMIFGLESCTAGPNFVRPAPPGQTKYLPGSGAEKTAAADGLSQRFATSVKVPTEWWRLFNDQKLDPIVQNALRKNQTLQAALATLRQSEANRQAGQGVYFPQIDGTFAASRQKSNPPSFGVPAPTSVFSLFTLSAAVSYVLDVFGGNRRAVEGLRAREDSSRYAALASYLTLTTNVVNTVIARAAYEAEVQATQDLIRAQKEEISLTEATVKAGTAAYSSLLSLKAQLADTQAMLPPLLQRISQSEHLLATLSGEAPSELNPVKITLSDLKLPVSLPKSIPSDLVRQRPDILQAEADLHVASAQIGVATAALLPSFSVTANAALTNTQAENLLTAQSGLWNLGASVTAPIFHGGALLARRRAAIEAFHAAFAVYKQTVLAALAQVADTLTALENDASLVQAQADSLASAELALKLVRANYRAGTSGYLQLLIAIFQYGQAKVGYLQAVGQRLQDSVALFAALGGGWWNSPGPTIREIHPPALEKGPKKASKGE